MTDQRLKGGGPSLDEITYQIADQVDECELLQRVAHQLAGSVRHRHGEHPASGREFIEQLEPQIVRARVRLAALVVERGELLAKLDGPAPAAPPSAPASSP